MAHGSGTLESEVRCEITMLDRNKGDAHTGDRK